MQHEGGRAIRRTDHLDVLTADAVGPAGAEGLHRSLLGREARGVARETTAAPLLAVSPLPRCEDAGLEALARRSLEGAPDARDVADVDPEPDDHVASAAAAGMAGGGVAGRRLDLRNRLSPLGNEVPLIDRVVDEVPRQHRVERIGAMDEAIRIDGLAASAAQPPERRPPGVGLGREELEDRRDAPVAAGEQRREIRLARALDLHVDAAERGELAPERGEPASGATVTDRFPPRPRAAASAGVITSALSDDGEGRPPAAAMS